MAGPERSPKRQRILYDPRDSSPDELGDYENHTGTYSARQQRIGDRREPVSPTSRRTSMMERGASVTSLSTDELAESSDDDFARRPQLLRRASTESLTPTPPRRLSSSPSEEEDDAEAQDQEDELAADDLDQDGEDAGLQSHDISNSATPGALVNDDIESPPSEPEASPPPPPPPPRPTKVEYRVKYVLEGHKAGVAQARFSPDGSMIASCAADATIKIWSTKTGALLQTFTGHLAGISTIAWSPDGNFLATGSDDKSIRLWNVITGEAHSTPYLGHSNYVYSLAITPKGNILVSGSYDEAVFIWETRTGRIIRKLPAHSDPVGGVDVVRDGTLVVSCASDGLIRIWDTITGQCLATMHSEDKPPCSSVRFSPNGKFVLAWSNDDCIRLWNYNEGRCVKTYQGHRNLKHSIGGGFGTYGVEGTWAFIVSGSEDGAVILWDVVSKEILGRFEEHDDVVLHTEAARRAEDGVGILVSCSLDRTIRIWEEVLPEPEEAEEELKMENGEAEGEDEQPPSVVEQYDLMDGVEVDKSQVQSEREDSTIGMISDMLDSGVQTPAQLKREDSDELMAG